MEHGVVILSPAEAGLATSVAMNPQAYVWGYRLTPALRAYCPGIKARLF
jgi:hypothetical protein